MLVYRFLFAFLLIPWLAFASPLEIELASDLLGRGYSGMTDTQFLISINTEDRTRNLTSVTGQKVKRHVDATEYKPLSDAKKQQFIELVKRDDLDLFGLDMEILKDIFGAVSKTVSNLVIARVESISRGVEIRWGVVTEKDLRMHTLSRKVRR